MEPSLLLSKKTHDTGTRVARSGKQASAQALEAEI
jgi:hypothetical protein